MHMAEALLGPYAGFSAMVSILMVQPLFFADSSLLPPIEIWRHKAAGQMDADHAP